MVTIKQAQQEAEQAEINAILANQARARLEAQAQYKAQQEANRAQIAEYDLQEAERARLNDESLSARDYAAQQEAQQEAERASKSRTINQAERAIRVNAQVMSDCAIAHHIEAERAWLVGNVELHDFKQAQAEIFSSYIPSNLLAEYDYYLFRALKQAGLAR